MKRSLYLWMVIYALAALSCKPKTTEKNVAADEAAPVINNQLTAEEKAGGLMTPEIMWKFGRLGSIALSPDGSEVLYTITRRDLQSEASETNIYKISSKGGEPVLLARGGSSPQWFDNGKKIAFVKGSDLMTMNADGSEQKKVEGLPEFEIFSISPDGRRIYFTRRVKLDQTANEKHNLPKAKVRIINDLMYRHWNAWSDY